MSRFDELQAKADALLVKQRTLHPLSDEWMQCELERFRIYTAQA